MEIITRAEARERGLTRYFTGKPCKQGHIAERLFSCGVCLDCQKLSKLNRSRSDREKAAAVLRSREARARDPERVRLMQREWRERNRERSNLHKVKYMKNGGREKSNIARRAKLESSPVAAMAHRVRRLVGIAFSRGGFTKESKVSEVLGCSWVEFATHVERQFLPGMTWANRSLWHVDHIVPLATAVTEADVLALNHFTNLRPMWALDNLTKNSKITHLL